jgi:uncharacterized protein YjiS (DUF1127 family)
MNLDRPSPASTTFFAARKSKELNWSPPIQHGTPDSRGQGKPDTNRDQLREPLPIINPSPRLVSSSSWSQMQPARVATKCQAATLIGVSSDHPGGRKTTVNEDKRTVAHWLVLAGKPRIRAYLRWLTSVIAVCGAGIRWEYESRRALRELQLMDDRSLKDMGISRCEIEYSAWCKAWPSARLRGQSISGRNRPLEHHPFRP